MFPVIFEVLPNKENSDDYLDNAKMLRPELEQVEGFVDNMTGRGSGACGSCATRGSTTVARSPQYYADAKGGETLHA